MNKPLIFMLGLATWLCLQACGKKNNDSGSATFDRGKMLENYAQNLIRPAFQDLQNQVQALKNATDAFVQTTNLANLTTLQNAWENAYLSFQYANAYNFGPAGEEGIRKALVEEVATFPVSATKIDNAITQNNANFNDFNRDARGFLAIEYLIFSLTNDNNAIVSSFTQNRKNFLNQAVTHLQTTINNIVNAWNGTYYQQFTSNVGTDVGSSTSQLYNEFVKSFESIKNFKVGLPLGKRPGQTQTEPQRVEAYYSGKSLAMLKVHLQAIENIWYGKTRVGQEGIGFKAYLSQVEGGSALISATETQLAIVKNALNQVPTSLTLATQIQNAPAPIDRLHTELQKHTRFFKSDMSSLLGIAITFSSGDGD